MSPRDLPEFRLSDGEIASEFREFGIESFRAAASHVRDLPYGRNSDRSNYRLVLDEGRGTCSTKHALLAALALEHGAGIELRIGIYLMSGINTPGTARVLRRHGLPGLPEAHCYLAYRDERIDVTGVEGGVIAKFLHEESIKPIQIGPYKVERHRTFLQTWALERRLDPDHVWRVREECIAALSSRDVASDGQGG